MSTVLIVLISSLVVLFLLVRFSPRYKRLVTVLSLFKPENIAHNFVHLAELFPVKEVVPSSDPTTFYELDSSFSLPHDFTYKEQCYNTSEYIDQSQTSGLIVLKEDTILHESYYRGFSRTNHHISWSVCKSVVGSLIGIAVREEMIEDINDPVEKYVPFLKGSGYEGTSVKSVLQMSTGIRFNEDYHDFKSDINKLGRVFALGLSFDKYVRSLKREREPGTFHNYISMDTQVLGMIIREVSGMSLAAFMEKYLWIPMGAENKAFWLTDRKGVEAAFGGLNCSLRDFARIGKLYMDQGVANGQQVIPKQWVYDSTHSTEAHLQAGDLPHLSTHPFGYGYQWWLPKSETGEYLAMGVYNQFIYVDPTHKVVISKNSSNFNFAIEKRETTFRHLTFFRSIRDKIIEHGI